MGADYRHCLLSSGTKAKDIFPLPTELKPTGLCLNSFWKSGTKNPNKITSDTGEKQKGEVKSQLLGLTMGSPLHECYSTSLEF